MEKHYGQIVEKRIRNSGYSIAEVARLTGVSRRSLYNWFACNSLNQNIIERLGLKLNCNFSMDFPDLFPADHFERLAQRPVLTKNAPETLTLAQVKEEYWRDKYVDLLEVYRGLLETRACCQQTKADGGKNYSEQMVRAFPPFNLP
jgi:hypothetical protein